MAQKLPYAKGVAIKLKKTNRKTIAFCRIVRLDHPLAQIPTSILPVFLSFFFLFWLPHSIWSSWARDQIRAEAVTYTTAVAMPDPLTHFARPGIELCTNIPEMLQILLCFSGNS